MDHEETLLLLPGLLCDARLWRDQIEVLGASRRVVVACLTGHDSIAAMAEAAASGLGGPLAVAGLSMGGYVALEVAPIKGNAVFFSYDRPHPVTRTLHGGAPVIAGEKWVATKWLREGRFD